MRDTAYRATQRYDGWYTENITYYDGADNILVINVGKALTFGYDPVNRLTEANDPRKGSYGSLGYLYDANGNRTSETRNGAPTPYTYYPAGSNWLFSAGNEARFTDPAGNTTYTSALGFFAYDGYGRTVGVLSGVAVYDYNAFHQRIKKTAGGVATSFHYGPQGELLYETDGTNTQAYVYLDGVPLARIDNNTDIYYYHTDYLGTPQLMTDGSGTTVWRASYEPFGRATITVSTITNNLRLDGYWDSETGLYYVWNRYYDPKTGRWTTVEPLGVISGVGDSPRVPREITKYFQSLPLNERLLDGLNHPYAYAFNNPLSYIDPDGLMGRGAGGGKSMLGPLRFGGGGAAPIEGPFGPVCGSGRGATWIPDGPWKDACQKHDDCYSRCGASRFQCDIDFLFDSGNVAYFIGVRVGGRPPFQNAQNESCCGQSK